MSEEELDLARENLNRAFNALEREIVERERSRIIELLRGFDGWVSCPCSECRATAASCGVDRVDPGDAPAEEEPDAECDLQRVRDDVRKNVP